SRHVRRRVPGVAGWPCRLPRDVARATPQWRWPPCRRLRRAPPGAGEECRLLVSLFVRLANQLQERVLQPAPRTGVFHRDPGMYQCGDRGGTRSGAEFGVHDIATAVHLARTDVRTQRLERGVWTIHAERCGR